MYLVTFFIQDKIVDDFLFEGLFGIVHEFEDGGSEGVFIDSFLAIVFDKEEYGHDSLLRTQQLNRDRQTLKESKLDMA